ncbi:MAG: FAD-binding protein, partial [Clostridia bacterium]|nr:FAD-binding protein [Clostridia bacterium]
IVTEGVLTGTSRNTGSDKQTYYKLGLSGDSPDSVRKMAENLFAGGSVDGDNALIEAALSTRCFMNLCELGVPFPVNRYGEYVGYKTDHDPFERATSAGPLTSKFMTEALQKNAERLHVPVFDGLLAVEIIKDEDNAVCGLLCLNTASGEFCAFRTPNVILCTGGPAGIYADSVFPACHTGTTSLALNAGASLQNMTEWQYGLASISPRWNVSGTYMQVLPRFVSVDAEGNEYEFLSDYFADSYEALSNVFLKGYQWPFDSRKVLSGSSVVDLLVYRECVMKGRKVYLDFTKNPFGLTEIDFTRLSEEAYTYLYKAEACFGTPIERLLKMNAPAVDLYKGKGLDITKEYLEIALCAQHNNGGIAVDLWWQTKIKGLFAAGECAGTHGVSRPGGSALNAGQVGSLRAAQYVGASKREPVSESAFTKIASLAIEKQKTFLSQAMQAKIPASESLQKTMRRMSDKGGAIREISALNEGILETLADLKNITAIAGVQKETLQFAYKLKDALTVQLATLTAFLDFAKLGVGTRGSALYGDKNGDLREGLNEIFRFKLGDGSTYQKVQEVSFDGENCQVVWRDVRPLPDGG